MVKIDLDSLLNNNNITYAISKVILPHFKNTCKCTKISKDLYTEWEKINDDGSWINDSIGVTIRNYLNDDLQVRMTTCLNKVMEVLNKLEEKDEKYEKYIIQSRQLTEVCMFLMKEEFQKEIIYYLGLKLYSPSL